MLGWDTQLRLSTHTCPYTKGGYANMNGIGLIVGLLLEICSIGRPVIYKHVRMGLGGFIIILSLGLP